MQCLTCIAAVVLGVYGAFTGRWGLVLLAAVIAIVSRHGLAGSLSSVTRAASDFVENGAVRGPRAFDSRPVGAAANRVPAGGASTDGLASSSAGMGGTCV